MNPLRRAPFTVIEGVNPDDSISAQMEQIDQLNTLLLQEIDENFAKFHQIVTSHVLPEVKRFALASEPTREAATFWRSFFERAASVKLSTHGEFTNTTASEDVYGDSQAEKRDQEASYSQDAYQYEDHEQTMDRTNQGYGYDMTADGEGEGAEDLSITSEDHSFLYGDQPMASSTPRASKIAGKGNAGKGQSVGPRYSDQSSVTSENDHSFANRRHPDAQHAEDDYSIDTIHASGHVQIDDAPSPFEHLDRRLREELVLDDERDKYEANSGDGEADETITGRQGHDEDAYDEEPSVILRLSRPQSQPKVVMRTEATPRRRVLQSERNEIGSPGWNGLTDLRTTPLNVKVKRELPASGIKFAVNPSRAGFSGKLPTQHIPIAGPGRPTDLTTDSMESSDFGITNMSPPVTTNFGNTITRRNIEKTPAKEAVRLVIDDLMRGIGEGFSPSPVMEADAAFAKYGFGASGLEAAVSSGTPSKSMGKRGQMLSQVSKRAFDRRDLDDQDVSLGDITARGPPGSTDGIDPDASTVGMPRGYREAPSNSSNTHDARSFLERSFASAADGNDSLEIEQDMQLPEGYDDPTILLGGMPYNPNASQGLAHSTSPGDQRLQRLRYPQRDLLDGETTVDADTFQSGIGQRDNQHTTTLNTMTTNSDLLRFSPASSEAASVFGGDRQRGFQNRAGGFALMGADDIHTFHGGRLEDAGTSPRASPSYALSRKGIPPGQAGSRQ
ncbi:hypothetical protein NliqN6_2654 [Naganishia liquefaciens]|uniref:DASH complex subunit ASK1 n=1 Tax=Naganishia liquefaciens TaxID=104408 RepID=A0A8H3TS80_9TREE|nr:hypothetical protein NliqN6_2654 [Naganishia liquefaciens]